MHPEQENVFEIRLNEDGVVRLKQILTLTRLLLIIGLAEIFVFIGDGIVRQLIYHGTADTRIDTTYSWMMTYFYPI